MYIYPLSRIHNTSLVSAYYGLDKCVSVKKNKDVSLHLILPSYIFLTFLSIQRLYKISFFFLYVKCICNVVCIIKNLSIND
jgi:hypothetical protein